MSISINTAADIAKILAFMKAQAPKDFNIRRELLEEVIRLIRAFAKKNKVSVSIKSQSRGHVKVFTAGGIVVGAAAGYAVASVPGAVIGGALGGALGFGCTKLEVCIEPRVEGDFFLSIQPT